MLAGPPGCREAKPPSTWLVLPQTGTKPNLAQYRGILGVLMPLADPTDAYSSLIFLKY